MRKHNSSLGYVFFFFLEWKVCRILLGWNKICINFFFKKGKKGVVYCKRNYWRIACKFQASDCLQGYQIKITLTKDYCKIILQMITALGGILIYWKTILRKILFWRNCFSFYWIFFAGNLKSKIHLEKIMHEILGFFFLVIYVIFMKNDQFFLKILPPFSENDTFFTLN